MVPQLEASRLTLRAFVPDDWNAINVMLSDPVTIPYMHFAAWTEDQRRKWFDACVMSAFESAAEDFDWAIARSGSGEAIGWFSIGAEYDDAIRGERRFGYLLDRAVWNQGYMTEALEAVLAYEFGTRGTPQLRATCNIANLASARVMEKAGMRREKTAFDIDFAGKWDHRHHYVITQAEYESCYGE